MSGFATNSDTSMSSNPLSIRNATDLNVFILETAQFLHVLGSEMIKLDNLAIGEGGQGVIRKMKHPKLGVCAVKTLAFLPGLGNYGEILALREFTTHCNISFHKNIVSFYGFIYEDNPPPVGRIYTSILMEYLPCGSLSDYLQKKPADESNIIQWSLDIARALSFIHSRNIWHRDIKPSNIMLAEDFKVAKLCDFGFAKPINREQNDGPLSKQAGTHHYSAPEMLDLTGRYDEKIDIWSLGISMWVMYSRRIPFEHEGVPFIQNLQEFTDRLKGTGGRTPQRPEFANLRIDSQMRCLIEQCWANDPKDRRTAEDLVLYLEGLNGGV